MLVDKDKDSQWLKYYYPGTNVIFNNYGIKDYDMLKEVEATNSFNRLMELQDKPINMNFDKNHLNEINKYLFEDVYPFAGKYRDINMPEEYGGFLEIKDAQDIGLYLDTLFEKTNKELMLVDDKKKFAELISTLYKELMKCHPFREGNGRTIREFVREFSIAKSKELGIGDLELDWSKIDKEAIDDNKIVEMFENALININKNEKNK